jgi:hypothetical protein
MSCASFPWWWPHLNFQSPGVQCKTCSAHNFIHVNLFLVSLSLWTLMLLSSTFNLSYQGIHSTSCQPLILLSACAFPFWILNTITNLANYCVTKNIPELQIEIPENVIFAQKTKNLHVQTRLALLQLYCQKVCTNSVDRTWYRKEGNVKECP